MVIVLIALTITEVHLNLARFNNNNVLKWDAICYYSYLPAALIEKDLSLSFITNETDVNYSWIKYGYIKTKNGERVIKTSMGVAILIAPFFLIAHSMALMGADVADGFSSIYQFFLEFSGLFYVMLGFVYLRKLMLFFYSEKIIAIAFLLLYFATNLLYHSAVDAVNPHVYTFGLFSVLLYNTYHFYQKPSVSISLILGLLLGLIFLVRPINVLFILPVFLFNIQSLQYVKERFSFIFIKHFHLFLLVMLGFIMCLLPQLLYYKMVTNSYFVFSYGEKERFYFTQPHIFDVLFSFRKGWFIYTPLMFVVVSWFAFKNKFQNSFFNVGTITLLAVYIYFISAWWCWWYGGSFGQRALIDLYPILLFPLCSLVYELFQWNKKHLKKIAFVGLGLLLVLNCFQTIQAKYNIIDWDGMTFKAYVHVFGTINSNNIRTDLLKKPNYDEAVMGLPED